MGHPVRMGTVTSPPGSSATWVWGHTSPLRPAVVNGSTAFTRQCRGGGPPWPAWHRASQWATSGRGQGGLTLKHSWGPRWVISAQGGGERDRTPTHTRGGGWRGASRAHSSVCPCALSKWPGPVILCPPQTCLASAPPLPSRLVRSSDSLWVLLPKPQPPQRVPPLGALSLGRAGAIPEALFFSFQTRAG